MAIEAQGYTPTQMNQLSEFRRAEKLVGFLRPQWKALKNGIEVYLADPQGEIIQVDIVGAKVMQGALRGMFNALVDAGLLEALGENRVDRVEEEYDKAA